MREIELRNQYPDKEALAAGIRERVEELAKHEHARCHLGELEGRRCEKRLIELVRYAGRSGLIR